MSESILPPQKAPKLIVVTAFDRDEGGDLQPAYGPAEQQTEDRAIRTAKVLAGKLLASLHGRVMPTQRWESTANQ